MSTYVLYLVLLINGATHKTAVDILPSMAACREAGEMQIRVNDLMKEDGFQHAVWICHKELVK